MSTSNFSALSIHTIFENDCGPNKAKIITRVVDQVANQDSEVQLPAPTTFKRQNIKTGFLSRHSGRAKPEHRALTEIAGSSDAGHRILGSTEVTSTTKTDLNDEEWRTVLEQCCK